MTEKKNWNDIDIGGLSMETPADLHERSRFQRAERVSCHDIFAVVLKQSENNEVKIHNLTDGKESTGTLLDISRSGVKLMTSEECPESNVLRLSFSVGERRFLFRAKVIWSKKEEPGYLAGLQFIEPNATDVDYIRSLYLAVSLK